MERSIMKKLYSIAERIAERHEHIPEQPYFTTQEVARLAGVSDRTVKERIKDGTLKAKKISNEWRIYPDSLRSNAN